MKSVALSGNKRSETGKTDAKAVRRNENVPCVLYGGKDNVHFQVNAIAFEKLINTPEVFFIDLDIDGASYKGIIKDVQFHPVTDNILHVDFLQVEEDKNVTVSVPVKITGSSKGVLAGGKLRVVTRKVKLNGLPSAMPENVEVDITPLAIGQSIKVGDLNLDGLSFLDSDNTVIAAVKMSRAAMSGAGAADEDEEGEEGEETEAAAEAPAAE